MRFAVLYPDEVYGRTFMDLFWTELQLYGGRIVGVEAYDPVKTDFSDPIRKLVGMYYPVPPDLIASRPKGTRTESHRKRGRAGRDADGENGAEELAAIVDFDAIFIPESPKIAGLLIPQLAFHDVRQVTLLGTNLWHSQSLLDLAEHYVQGAILPDGFFAKSSAPEVRAFVQRFEAAFQDPPGYIEAILYDSAMILFDVIRRPDVRFRGDIRAALTGENGFLGVTGHTRFDETGEAVKRSFLLRIDGNEFVELDRR
jgi:ABC-type branched-subunit amino acid transport system substrate-binding protein